MASVIGKIQGPKAVKNVFCGMRLSGITKSLWCQAPILQHLNAVDGAAVELKLEVEVNAPKGIPNATVRTVSEKGNKSNEVMP